MSLKVKNNDTSFSNAYTGAMNEALIRVSLPLYGHPKDQDR
jgi:hypothetical protein